MKGGINPTIFGSSTDIKRMVLDPARIIFMDSRLVVSGSLKEFAETTGLKFN